MKTILIAAAAMALSVPAAQAAPKPHLNALVGPDQPIPYARLGAYAKASAKTKATGDWWSGSASPASAAAVDASATASAGTPIDTPTPGAANPARKPAPKPR